MKKIGILTSGGDCGGLNAAIRSIFFRAKNKYGMTVFGIKNGTTGLVQRPLDFIELNQKNIFWLFIKTRWNFLRNYKQRKFKSKR